MSARAWFLFAAVSLIWVNPVIAVALGVVFLGESPGPGVIVGLALILAGSWLATAGGSGHGAVRRPQSAK
ncbi:MAG TPA: hypothetical protein VMS11_08100 [Solirubrobacterales bacterium]|nr:hypothetical protein [Solirubrobacterales bacterium]